MKDLPVTEPADLSNYPPGSKTHDPSGVERASVSLNKLTDLWFFTGTQCNLACVDCYTGSSPTNEKHKFITLADVKEYIHVGEALGVRQMGFTGGEPFRNPHIEKIIEYALAFSDVLVLSNGTKLARKKLEYLAIYSQDKSHDLKIRISLDSPYEQEHDAIRDPEGKQKSVYWQAVHTLMTLSQLPVELSVAGQIPRGMSREECEQQYRKELGHIGLKDFSLELFPKFKPVGKIPTVTPECFPKLGRDPNSLMCSYQRMIVKTDKGMSVYACTLTEDFPDFDLGSNLKKSLNKPVYLAAPICYTGCIAGDTNCSGK